TAFASVMGPDGTVAALPCATHRRGWLHPGRRRLSTTQPPGLARAWSSISPQPPPASPAPEAHGRPPPGGGPAGQQSRRAPAGGDIHHLRGYRPGDPRRTIAWKPSARRDTLLVRE